MVIRMSKAEVKLVNWNIVQISLPDGESGEFFIGYSIQDGIARFSTRIVEYDEKNRVGKTHSGSTYELIGGPGHPCEDGMYLLCDIFGTKHVFNELFSSQASGIISFKYSIN